MVTLAVAFHVSMVRSTATKASTGLAQDQILSLKRLLENQTDDLMSTPLSGSGVLVGFWTLPVGDSSSRHANAFRNARAAAPAAAMTGATRRATIIWPRRSGQKPSRAGAFSFSNAIRPYEVRGFCAMAELRTEHFRMLAHL